MTSGIAGGRQVLALVVGMALALGGCGDSKKSSADGGSGGTGAAGGSGGGGGAGGGSGGSGGGGGSTGGSGGASGTGGGAADAATVPAADASTSRDVGATGGAGGSAGTDAVSVDIAPRDLGGDGLAVGASGLDPSKKISALSDAELGQLCDWTAARLGGYGTTKQCPGGITIRNRADRAACVGGTDRTAATCTATVAQAEACVLLQVQDICSLASLSNPNCQALLGCSRP
jgi:hypothetical protein